MKLIATNEELVKRWRDKANQLQELAKTAGTKSEAKFHEGAAMGYECAADELAMLDGQTLLSCTIESSNFPWKELKMRYLLCILFASALASTAHAYDHQDSKRDDSKTRKDYYDRHDKNDRHRDRHNDHKRKHHSSKKHSDSNYGKSY